MMTAGTVIQTELRKNRPMSDSVHALVKLLNVRWCGSDT